jgi:hypothetical protein
VFEVRDGVSMPARVQALRVHSGGMTNSWILTRKRYLSRRGPLNMKQTIASKGLNPTIFSNEEHINGEGSLLEPRYVPTRAELALFKANRNLKMMPSTVLSREEPKPMNDLFPCDVCGEPIPHGQEIQVTVDGEPCLRHAECEFEQSLSAPAQWALGGWELGLIFTASGGVPFSATWGTGSDPALTQSSASMSARK